VGRVPPPAAVDGAAPPAQPSPLALVLEGGDQARPHRLGQKHVEEARRRQAQEPPKGRRKQAEDRPVGGRFSRLNGLGEAPRRARGELLLCRLGPPRSVAGEAAPLDDRGQAPDIGGKVCQGKGGGNGRP